MTEEQFVGACERLVEEFPENMVAGAAELGLTAESLEEGGEFWEVRAGGERRAWVVLDPDVGPILVLEIGVEW